LTTDKGILQVSYIVGNIYRNKKLMSQYLSLRSAGRAEVLKINRFEAERVRLRRMTDRGTDLAILTSDGTKMNHGDVLVATNKRFIIVQQEPELVMTIRMRAIRPISKLISVSAIIGHIIGNLHRPISTEYKSKHIVFPLLSDSEYLLFERQFSKVLDYVELKVEHVVFLSNQGADIYEHRA
jgi:urease accessory protein